MSPEFDFYGLCVKIVLALMVISGVYAERESRRHNYFQNRLDEQWEKKAKKYFGEDDELR